MRPQHEFDLVMALVAEGLNDCQIARMTGIPRRTILDWRSTERRRGRDRRVGARVKRATDCFRCRVATFDEDAYAYLLGLYLGDGCLSRNRAST